jgi:lipopolysaccharide transport system ATP-binding protein
MIDTAVHVENIGKQYRLGLNYSDSLADLTMHFARSLFGRTTNTGAEKRDFWAVRDISFDVNRGEVFGIIGRNGAGKSTLLKLISRVSSPSTGRIDLYGRVASLLEVGTGFHPELTGRENIFINGTLLGMTRREVRDRLDEIVEFAGVQKFLETPVKRYSSGMRVRLGFAVAAHLRPEILIIDEVLTVGDAEFQSKCLGKMKSVATDGRTVLFVSHNMGAVRNLCTRACLLDGGKLITVGSTDSVVDQYFVAMGKQQGTRKKYPADQTFILDGEPVLRPISFTARSANLDDGLTFTTEQEIELRFEYEPIECLTGVRIGITVRNTDNVILFGSNYALATDLVDVGGAILSVSCLIPGSLLNRGSYVVDIGIDRPPQINRSYLDQESIQFEVVDVIGHGTSAEVLPGVVRPKLRWSAT